MVYLAEGYFSAASIKWPLRVALYVVNLGKEDDSSDSVFLSKLSKSYNFKQFPILGSSILKPSIL